MKRVLLSFIMMPVLGYSQQVILPFGSGKATFDVSNKILNTKLDYSLGPFSYQRVNKTETLSFKNKEFSLQMSEKKWLLQGKIFTFNYLDSKNGLVYKNYWGKTAYSKYLLKFQGSNYQAELAKNYGDISLNFGSAKFRTIQTPTQSDSTLALSGKTWALEATNAKDRVSKNLINLKSGPMNLKFINDGSINATQITTNNGIFAYSNGQFFVHSKFQNMEWQASKDNYEVKYRGLSATNKQLKFEYSPNKQLTVELGTKSIINRVRATSSLGKAKLTASFDNNFSVDSFFLNQAIFNVHDATSSLIAYSKQIYRKSLQLGFESSNFMFSGDVVNSLYSMSAKFENGSVGFIQDQKRSFASMSYVKGNFNLALDYNCVTDRVDRLRLNYSTKF